MDLLSQYQQEHPEAFQGQKQAPAGDEYGRAYTGTTALVIRISGGRIRDARQVMYVLFIAGAVIFSSIDIARAVKGLKNQVCLRNQ